MLQRKHWVASLMVVCLSGLAFSAQAGDLVIKNGTAQPSTSLINGAMCSNKLPSGTGITNPCSTNTIPSQTLALACVANPTNCTAAVYMNNSCSQPVIANVVMDVNTGIKSIVMTNEGRNAGYTITGSGFTIQATGGSGHC